MSRRKVILIAAVVALVAAALGWWMDWRATPVVRFVGFRDGGWERVAVFEVENRSARTILFSRIMVTRNGESGEVKASATWNQLDASSGLPSARPSGTATYPDEQLEFRLSLSEVAGTAPQPFRAGAEYLQPAPKFLRYPPFSWLPAKVRSTRMKMVWSEVVTP